MRLRDKKVVFPFLFITIAIAASLFYWFRSRPDGMADPLPLPQQKEWGLELERRGVQGLREKQYAPLIFSLERMVKEHPEQVEIKRKLSEVYRAIGQDEKADALLKEIP